VPQGEQQLLGRIKENKHKREKKKKPTQQKKKHKEKREKKSTNTQHSGGGGGLMGECWRRTPEREKVKKGGGTGHALGSGETRELCATGAIFK